MTEPFRALVVDDDPLSRDVAAALLRKLGAAEVATFARGDAALAWAEAAHRRVDLVLCDLRMPGLDGLETLDGLAARTFPQIFALVSGADGRALRAAAAAAAARLGHDRVRLAPKPLSLEGLRSVVDALAGRTAAPGADILLRATPADCSTDLLSGLTRGEFVPLLQPRIDVGSGAVVAAQAVPHWLHPKLGRLPPEPFMQVAADVGLDADIFSVILTQLVADLAGWRRAGHRVGAAVGIPGRLLARRDLPRQLEHVLDAHGCEPAALTLEVDETAWLQDIDLARELLTRLRLRGFGIAIARFGTGASTVRQLIDAPFNVMKLDPSCLRGAPDDREMALALSAYVAIARRLDMTVVADGVETEAARRAVAALPCTEMQGPLFAPPLPAAEFMQLLPAIAGPVHAEAVPC